MIVVRRRKPKAAAAGAMDTETTGLCRWIGHMPFAVGLVRDDGSARYWEWVVDPKTRRPRVPEADVRDIQAEVDALDAIDYWNAAFDVTMLETIGVAVPMAKVHEVSFMARAVNNLEFAYKLKPLAKKYGDISDGDEKALHDMVIRARRLAKKLGYEVAEDVEQDYWLPNTLTKLHPGEARAAGIDGTLCGVYCRRDCDRTKTLGGMYRVAMQDLGVEHVYKLEMELLPETMRMERLGVRIHESTMRKKRAECEAKIAEVKSRLNDLTESGDFNINSPKQVGALLFGERSAGGLAAVKRTKTGQAKTDADALAPHKHNPVVRDVLTLRANNHAMKTFFTAYERFATPSEDGLILHPGYSQWGTLTGRYTCSNPNLLAVSDPDTSNSLTAEFMVDIREIFGPRDDCVWYCPDYSQVEVVIFADVSGEPTMIQAIKDGHDIHAVTAEKVWGGVGNPKAVTEVMGLLDTQDRGRAVALLEEHSWRVTELEKALDKKVIRKKAKSVTFTKIYGGGHAALQRWINVDKARALRILAEYDDSFPTMKDRVRDIEMRGKKDGYVLNIYGRRLEVDPWNAYRAVNHVVQSSAADLMKRGMLKTAKYLRETGLDARIVLTIHDELIFEFRKRHCYKPVLRRLKELMSDHDGTMSIPVTVDMGKVVNRWSDKVKVEGV